VTRLGERCGISVVMVNAWEGGDDWDLVRYEGVMDKNGGSAAYLLCVSVVVAEGSVIF